MIFKLTLEDLGHKQPKIPVHCDNAMAIGIAINTIKQQRSQAMEMRYFWTCKKDAQNVYSFQWHPGMENLADYQSKHHAGVHHTVVGTYYLHEKNSPREVPHANQPSTLKGCVGTLKDGYVHNVPLPRIGQIQSASPTTSHERISPKVGIPLPGYLPVTSWIPTLPKIGSILGFSQRALRPFSPIAMKAKNNLLSYAHVMHTFGAINKVRPQAPMLAKFKLDKASEIKMVTWKKILKKVHT
jgi:hypothetical protein